MQIYNYHSVTGEFVSENSADSNPLTEGEWLIPAQATSVAPPIADEGEVAVFLDNEWAVVADNRNTTYWLADGSEHSIRELGVDLPAEALTEKPGPDLNEMKVTLKREIDDHRDALLEQGFLFEDHRYQADVTSASRINGGVTLVLLAEATGGTFEMNWIDAADREVPLDGVKMKALGQACALHVDLCVKAGRAHKDAIDKLETIPALKLYDDQTGWP